MRTPRARCESSIYHIVARGAGRQLIFEDDADRESFLSLLHEATSKFHVLIYAWCLMGNHIHLLLKGDISDISKTMQAALSAHALRYNEKTGRTGHLFQERFRSEPVEDDEYLLCVLRYIHLNPEKARIAPHDSYRWSSYSEYLGDPVLCDTSFILSLFGSVKNFSAFHLDTDDDGRYLDLSEGRSSTRPLSDEEAIHRAHDAIGEINLAEIKSLEKSERNRLLIELLKANLSVRQIERLTGIGRGIIDYAKKHVK